VCPILAVLFGKNGALRLGVQKKSASTHATGLNTIFQASQEGIMFHLLWEAIIGLIVGALAKFIMPGNDPGGIFITMLIGVAGALLATFIGSHVGLYQEGQRAGFIMSVVGAIILLALYRVIKGVTAKA
jgi:uncharacterized membrane protein YeaQ/YmgE (transglycosylase-associated protein family)